MMIQCLSVVQLNSCHAICIFAVSIGLSASKMFPNLRSNLGYRMASVILHQFKTTGEVEDVPEYL